MDKYQSVLVEAIKNAERAVALMKDCQKTTYQIGDSITRIQGLAAAASEELAFSQTAISDFIKNLGRIAP